MIVLAVKERDLQRHVRAFAEQCGWRCYHTYDSRLSDYGFPDLLLVRNGECVAIELKSEKGKATAEQQAWLDDLAKVPGVTFAGVLRPSDWYAGVLDGVLR